MRTTISEGHNVWNFILLSLFIRKMAPFQIILATWAEQEHLLLLTVKLSLHGDSFLALHLATNTAVLLFSKLASLKSATCTREPEICHRVYEPFKSTSFTMCTTISVGYGVKFILLSRNHKKDCTNPNHTWHLSRSTSYSLWWSWPHTVLFEACTSPISIQPTGSSQKLPPELERKICSFLLVAIVTSLPMASKTPLLIILGTCRNDDYDLTW